jgi:DNA-binding NtrC family response regulator
MQSLFNIRPTVGRMNLKVTDRRAFLWHNLPCNGFTIIYTGANLEQPLTSLNPEKPIVVIDDEPAALQGVALHLRVAGYTHVKTFSNAAEAVPLWQQDRCAAVVLDVIMPGRNGCDVLKEIKSAAPHIPVIMVTGANEIDTAVNCLKNGAFDYLLKPLESERLITSLANALRIAELEHDYSRLAECMLAEQPANPAAFTRILTQSEKMLQLFKYVESVGPTSHPVLITGETGVGKELFAHALHAVSGRRGEFVCVNIAGLDDAMFSDTLFGHIRGAFTGADTARPGLIESATGGTIFLDEIGDLNVQSQVKLLRLIQEKEYRQLGSDAMKPCDARIVTATCRGMDELSASPQFRKDLFYRLRTHHIHIPPLRDRKEDIPLLADAFIARAAGELRRNMPQVPHELCALLSTYYFPGNVRELEAMVFDALSTTHNGKLSLKIFRDTVGAGAIPETDKTESKVTFHEHLPSLKEVEKLLILEARARAKGNQTIAANLLGITRQTLAYRLKQVDIAKKERHAGDSSSVQ